MSDAVAKFSQLSVVVNNGAGTLTVIVGIPPGPASDPNATDQSTGQDSAQQAPGVAGLVQTITKMGLWDAAGANFYPPSAILKISAS